MRMTLKKLQASNPGVTTLLDPKTLAMKYYPALTWANADDVMLVEADEGEPRERKSAAAALKAATRLRLIGIKKWKP